jgi:aminopeptidase N
MSSTRTLLASLSFAVIASAHAQPVKYGCHYFRNKGPVQRTLTPSERSQISETIARSDTFDIRHYDIAIDVTDYGGQYIEAATTITFRARMADQTSIRFDLYDLVVDSVIGASGPMAFTYDGQYLNVPLATAPVVGEDQEITVHYHGNPHRDPGWGGFYFASNYIYNLGIGLTTIPPNFGKVWYPCFDSFVERATYTYHVKSAGTFRLHGQGTFLGEVQLGGDTVVRSYQLAQEIPTHLSAIAVANYRDSTWVHNGANGDIPVTLSAKPADLNAMVTKFEHIGAAIDACEYWYGPYAYERVGYVHTTDGALEIPTNVAYPDFMTGQSVQSNRALLTHELGHHWWGDIVTPYVHNDMWLKEGPAEYSSHLIEEWLFGREAFVNTVKGNLLNIMSSAHIDDGGFQALSPMPDPYIYGTHTYDKGAAVMHNLRGYLGDDLFRTAMREVQAQYANTAITAVGFKEALEEVTGADLDPFFDAWVFAPGYAVFEVRSWSHTAGSGGEEVQVNIGQKLYGATVMHTNVPLQLTMVSATGEVFDTMIEASGAFSTAEVVCPFVPEMVVLNRYHTLNQARMDHEITLVPGVTFSNSLPWVDFRLFADNLVDSTLVRVEHIWSGADQAPLGFGLTDISNTHYWNVEGVWPEGTALNARLLYFGGSPTQFDHDLVAGDETGMVVAYRRTADEPWQVYADQTVNTGITTNGTGTININVLAKGQYAFAKMIGAIGMPEREGGAFSIHPVPVNDRLNIALDREAASLLLLDVLTTDGKLVQRSTIGAGMQRTQLDVTDLSEGNYLLRIADTAGDQLGARSFVVTR